jgi:hypothetical protein
MTLKIRLRHKLKLMRISIKLFWNLRRIDVAGLLVRLAFKISPQLERSMQHVYGKDAIRKYERDMQLTNSPIRASKRLVVRVNVTW